MKDLWSTRALGVVERRELCLPLESDVKRDFQPLFRFSPARPSLGIGYHHLDRDDAERHLGSMESMEEHQRSVR